MIPPRVLPIKYLEVTPAADWVEDDETGDPWIGTPYRWTVRLEVTAIFHGSHRTREPFVYHGADIKVGDWISDIVDGLAVQIISIVSLDPGGAELTVVVEDVDRFNQFMRGGGIGNVGAEGVCFGLSEEGTPILGPAPAAILGQNAAWAVDQMSRFNYRNIISSYFRVEQVGHTLEVGDVIRIRTDEPNIGTYEKVAGDASVVGVVGVVNSIGTPGMNWFTFRPSGRVVTNLTPLLPGVAGNLIYLDETGGYTTTRPSSFVKPIFIRLTGDGSMGLQLDRNVDLIPAEKGYIAQTYVVNDLTERDALTSLNEGDMVKVRNVGNGEWATYLYDDDTWSLLATEDASDTDAETLDMDVTEAGTFLIGTISAGSRVTMVTVTVVEAFPADASITVGTSTHPSRLMPAELSDLTVLASFTATPAFVFDGPNDTGIDVVVATSGPGRAKVAITYT